MNENFSIKCPQCKTEIPLTETLAQPVIEAERAKAQREADKRDAALKQREQELATNRQQLVESENKLKLERVEIDALVEKKIGTEREAIGKVAHDKAAGEFAAKLKSTEQQLAEQKARLAEAEASELEARQQREALERDKRNLELTISRRLDEERDKLRQEAAAQEQERWKTELADREQQLAEKDEKLRQAQAAELSVRKDRQNLEEQKRSLELEVERRVDEERLKVREATLKQEDESHRLKLAEKDKVIDDMRKQVEEMRRKSEQGSQQLQGEVQELELETVLKQAFPGDQIEPVQKGRTGGDVVQKVIGAGGLQCGSILWESKRTKNWSDDWLAKNREDQRTVNAHLGVIVTAAMPKGVDSFTRMEGVWVSNLRCVLPLAHTLRHGLIQTAMAHVAGQGRDGKMEATYSYLTGQDFRQRVAAIVEAYVGMRTDLDGEKRAITKQWAKREKQLELLVTNTAGMYGDLQGIVGKTMPEIEGLAIPLLNAPEASAPPALEAVSSEMRPAQ